MIDAASLARRDLGLPFRITSPSVISARRVAVGLTAVAVAMLPTVVPRGPGNVGPADLFIAVAVGACLLWSATSGHPLRLPYVVPIALILAGGAIGALAGPVPETGIIAIAQDAALAAFAWAVVNISASMRTASILFRTWAYSSIAWALVLFAGLALGMPALTGQTDSEGSRTALTFGDPNVSANYYFISMMIIWATRCPRHPAARFGAYALLLAALLSTGSNSGIVSLTVGVGAAAVVAVYGRRGTVAAATALAFILVVGFLATSSISISEIQARAHESRYAFVRDGIGRGQSSVEHRDALRRQSISLYETSGFLGSGPVSTKPRLERELAPLVKEAHNDYFAALLERGVVGVLGLLLLVLGVATRTVSLTTPEFRERFAPVLARPHAVVGAVAGTLTAMTVYELLHVRHVWALFAFVAALHLWTREWPRRAS